ncbi:MULTISPECIES: glycosyltransferase [unclassified Streptomyces]|uniref:glycosyltransferase n=1 Tax=unclassified Streptomyces TaxID=2593676 RepID=UPI002254EBCD|nr:MULTISPECIES: nucleotide disphospho-sugar-binding domain-containing protein [unclassified Streptomyces]MCX4524597.1 glycosyltransferase [Streptomyces sp. NBC_01551]MCX4544879.1 glycosyltransferase [Streptomyces sp. NBC_01565]
MRVLFTVPPLAGHVNPTVAVGAELASRGHEIAWCGPAGALARLLPPHARILPAGEQAGDRAGQEAGPEAAAAAADGGYAALHERWRDLRGVAALRFLWEEALVPLARDMVPGVTDAVRSFAPDLLVADQQALAGPVVARRLGIPWATSATTSAELTLPFADFPKVGEWVDGQIAGFLSACGEREAGWDPRFSERLVLVFSTPELVGPADRFPPHYAFVGPAFGARPPAPGFPWHRLDPERRRVLVSLGTLNQEAGARFYGAVLGAAERLAQDVQLVLVAPADLIGAVPANVLVQDRVPQLELLAHLDAVISHGGHNTVCEALAYGLPLVVAPIRDDQPIVARQVVEAGAGVRVRFGRTRAEELRDALTAVLDDPGPRRAARRIQASFAAAGGAAAAADRLEKLL